MKSSAAVLLRRCFCVLVAIAACGGIAHANPNAVPFKAAIAINETVSAGTLCPVPPGFPPGVPILQGAIVGTGEAGHIGRLSASSTDCINPLGVNVFQFVSDHVVLTAVNGDQIFAKYQGTLTLANGVGKINGLFTITGGTGRFVRATGFGNVLGAEALNLQAGTGQGEIELSGVISY